ncbi:DUF6153 family protein [Streptomyces sp. NPDC058642]|uniref:DUF6153 family protein n=1 Tax=Streptomyces sp. NPDC058642 TaxID=3346572 RepID=UPI00364A6777
MTMDHASATEQARAACSHTDGGSGHLARADGTCAAPGIDSGIRTARVGRRPGRCRCSHRRAGICRAEPGAPDLSELQLLRI